MKKIMYLTVIIASSTLVSCGSDAKINPETVQISAAQRPVKPAKPASEPPISDAAAMLDRGRVLFKRCKACHTLDEGGRHRVGPNLWAISGAMAGQKDGFTYSAAMRDSGVIWTDENLAAYIANPRKFMPKNRMSFAGLRKPEDQAAVIAYIKEKTSPQ